MGIGSLTLGASPRHGAERAHARVDWPRKLASAAPTSHACFVDFKMRWRPGREAKRQQLGETVKADWLRRKTVPHTAKKLGIPLGRVVAIRRSLGLRGRAEPRLHLPVRHPDFPFKLFRRPSRPREWMCWSPFSRRSVRVARFLAERRLGRALRPDEWAILEDGDNENLTDESVLVCSPQEAHRFRNRRKSDAVSAE